MSPRESRIMPQCGSCHHTMPADCRFCPACGTPVPALPPNGAAAADASTVAPGPDPILVPGETPRFTPGVVLGGRYRVIALLGRGGMGEVYRADDLKLGQAVALKFLPGRLASNPRRLADFHSEVRLARQVTHPNVCRVHDIGEIDGQPFLSMEYVDGEDLASLLRRIGRLPADKGLEIARQLCSGLAAAHDQGVLHRDLKPANVMLDGRGQVRIADFGLARLADQMGEERGAGTPAYMAPELFAGEEATVQSDLYAVGLVLYEIFTGKRAAETRTPAMAGRGAHPPLSPSSHIPDLDPAIERVILRCLEEDPKKRPSSARAVVAGLPGGDPLAAALAAGETPSPELVAAAGKGDGPRPAVAIVVFAALLAPLIALPFLANSGTILGLVRPPLAPDVLENRAREIVTRLGYEAPTSPSRSAYGFDFDDDYLDFLGRGGPETTPALRAMYFWYRQSPLALAPRARFTTTVTFDDPPQALSGMLRLILDPRGNLIALQAAPPQVDESVTPARPPDWSELFGLAGLRQKEFQPAGPPRWNPSMYVDHLEEWDGPGHEEGSRVRVIAASYGGRPVYFAVLYPWDRPVRMPSSALPVGVGETLFGVINIALLVVAALLTRRNLRLGRSDRRNALIVAMAMFAFRLLRWVFGASHAPTLPGELDLFRPALYEAIYMFAFVWLTYLALEPYVRRLWPQTLISWTRLLAGRFNDPLIGRDLLAGAAGGAFWAATVTLAAIVMRRMHLPVELLMRATSVTTLLGTRQALAQTFQDFSQTITASMFLLLNLLLFRIVLRNRWLANGAFVAVWTVIMLKGDTSPFSWVLCALAMASIVSVLTRLGLLACMMFLFSWYLLVHFPVTADASAWYAGTRLFATLLVAALGIYGFWTCVAGRMLAGHLLGPR